MVCGFEGEIVFERSWFVVDPVRVGLSRLVIGDKSDSRLWFIGGLSGEKNKSSVCQRGVSNSFDPLLALIVSQ